MYMNVAYRYLISRADVDSIIFHPFVDSLSHHLTTQDLLRKVTAPEVKPNPSVLLVEGDFTTVFSKQQGEYDLIVTHFFIDTARNLISYFDTIHRLLKHGGYWINFGPLLYGTGPFVQLSLDEVVSVVERMGFEFQEIDVKCGNISLDEKKVRWSEAEYGFNGRALAKNAYKAQAWVARRP
jgi:carnosine N-methyltransferase